MIEAYKVAVSLVMDSNVGRETGALIQQMRMLERAVSNVQMGVNQLAAGMRGLARIGTSAASAWTDAARAMERAANAAQRGGRAMSGGLGDGVSGGPSGGVSSGPRAAGLSPAGLSRAGPGPSPSGASGQRLLGWDGPRLYGPPFGPSIPSGGYVPGGRAMQGPGYALPLLAGATGGAVAVWGGGGRPPTIYGGGSGPPVPFSGGPRPPIPLHFTRMPKRSSGHDFALAALGYGAVGGALTGFVGDVVGAGMTVGQIGSSMQLAGYTPDEIKALKARAQREARAIPGVTVAGAMEAERDIFTLSRSKPEAQALAPSLLRMSMVLASVGKTDQLAAMFNAARSGELKGIIPQGPEAFGKFLKMVEGVTVATQGRFGPAQMLQFMMSSGAAGGFMDDKDFGLLLPMILSMGAQRGGTALRGLFQQFVTGRMSQASGNALVDVGLADKKKLKKYGIGMYMAQPGWLAGESDLDQGKYAEWMHDYLLPAIHRYDLKKYGTDNLQLMVKTGSQMASRIPGANALAEFFRLLPQSASYAKAVKDASGPGGFAKAEATNPALQLMAMQAAWTNFLTALANGPVMNAAVGTLQDVTGALNALGKWAEDHKALAALLVQVAAGLGAVAVAIASIAGVLWVAGPMLRVGKWGLARAGLAGVGGDATAAAGGGAAAGIFAPEIMLPLALGALLWNQDPLGLNDITPADVWHRIFGGGGHSVAPPAGGGTVHLHGDVTLDGERVGSLIAGQHADQFGRPPAGPSGADPRMSLPIPGFGGVH